VITIPASAIVAAIFYWLISAMFVRVLIAIGLIVLVGFLARTMSGAVLTKVNS
jgi:hypothetical protein